MVQKKIHLEGHGCLQDAEVTVLHGQEVLTSVVGTLVGWGWGRSSDGDPGLMAKAGVDVLETKLKARCTNQRCGLTTTCSFAPSWGRLRSDGRTWEGIHRISNLQRAEALGFLNTQRVPEVN